VRRAGTFFLLAFAITWVIWVPRAINPGGFFDQGVGEVLGTVWSYGPALAALSTALVFGGRPGLREIGSRLENWRVGWIWYAVAIVGLLSWFSWPGSRTWPWAGRWGKSCPTCSTRGSLPFSCCWSSSVHRRLG
jgi:hypothetical protein